MSLKLCVGLSKKVGERNYGSRAASVSFELELDTATLQQADRIQEYIRRLYSLARASLHEELQGQSSGLASASREGNSLSDAAAENGHGPSESNDLNNPIVRPATEGQVKAIYSLANRKQLDLAGLMRSRYCVERVEHLSLPAASVLIDELKHENGPRPSDTVSPEQPGFPQSKSAVGAA